MAVRSTVGDGHVLRLRYVGAARIVFSPSKTCVRTKPGSGATCDARHEIGLIVSLKMSIICMGCFVPGALSKWRRRPYGCAEHAGTKRRKDKAPRDKAPHSGYANPFVLHDFGFGTKHPQTACGVGPCRVLERYNPRGSKSSSISQSGPVGLWDVVSLEIPKIIPPNSAWG